MTKLPTTNYKLQTGFTLIEAVVATALFAFTVSSILGVYTSVIQLDRKTRAQRAVAQNARFITDYLAKEVRNGVIDYSGSSCANSATTFCLINQGLLGEKFTWNGVDTLVLNKNGSITNLNSASVKVTKLTFWVSPAGDPYTPAKNYNEQPHVTIILELTSNYGTGPTDLAKIDLENTFAIRNYSSRTVGGAAPPPPPPTTWILTVAKSGSGGGTVAGGGINCGSTCSNSYADDMAVALTATPDVGSVFSNWSGDCSGSGVCNLTMSANHSVTAIFTGDTTKPTVSTFDVNPKTTSGSVTATFTATDSGGSHLKNAELWRAVYNSSNCTVSVVTGCTWSTVNTTTDPTSNDDGPWSGSMTDTPSIGSSYIYGVHVYDNAGNFGQELARIQVDAPAGSILTWYDSTCTTTLGSQDMSVTATLALTTPGTYCVKVNTAMILIVKGAAGGGGGGGGTGGNPGGNQDNGGGGGGSGAVNKNGVSIQLLQGVNYQTIVGISGTIGSGGNNGAAGSGGGGGMTKFSISGSTVYLQLNGGGGGAGAPGTTSVGGGGGAGSVGVGVGGIAGATGGNGGQGTGFGGPGGVGSAGSANAGGAGAGGGGGGRGTPTVGGAGGNGGGGGSAAGSSSGGGGIGVAFSGVTGSFAGGGGGGAGTSGVGTSGGTGQNGALVFVYAGVPFATGGTVTTSGLYTIHTFTYPGGTFTVNGSGTVQVLVVAGGGSGTSGGGGAGGMLENNSYSVTPGNITVTVGAGGTVNNNNAGNSVFGTIIATAGGRGQDTSGAGFNGGSGGGANATQNNHGTGIVGQGNNGGDAAGANGGGGGGGGNAAGTNGSGSSGGNGGGGRVSSISGSAVTYAGGGGAAGLSAGGSGGVGGGGNGGVNSSTAGQANTGGGGGGGWYVAGASGGSGIVIVRYLTPDITKPIVTAFDVNPKTTSGSVTATFTATDSGGSHLKNAELWRAVYNSSNCTVSVVTGCTWSTVNTTTDPTSNDDGPWSGSMTDTPSIGSSYIYGVHVYDNAGNFELEPARIKVDTYNVANVTWNNISSVSSSLTTSVSSTNSLIDITSCGWGCGATSQQSIASGDGYVQFSTNENNTYKMGGLTHGNTSDSYTDITYAMYPDAGGGLEVYENGAYRGSFSTYVAGDVFRVAVESGVVKYRKNGTLIYTSTVAPAYPLIFDSSFYTANATETNVVISTDGITSNPVQWAHLTNNVNIAGNSLTANYACNWTCGGYANENIGSGDGYVEFSTSETNTYKMLGLTPLANENTYSYTDIGYAAYPAADGNVYVYENGANKGIFGAYAANDVFRVSVISGVVKYSKNGTVFYTSLIAPTYPLLVDYSLYTSGATLKNVKIQTNGSVQLIGNASYADVTTMARALNALAGSIGSSPAFGGTLTLNGVALGNYEYAIKNGDQTISSFNNSDWFTATQDTVSTWDIVNGNLTINAGQNFIPSNRKLFTVIYVKGNLTVNGSISMTARGANHSATLAGNIRIISGTYSGVVNPQVPAGGGAGGGKGTGGTAGTAGGTGGGAGGGGAAAGITNGSAGTSFSGGAGGGGDWSNGGSGGAASAATNGGAGGNGYGGGWYANGGGAGNPGGAGQAATGYGNPGSNGTGGTLIIIVEGTYSGSGTVTANGTNGGSANSGGYGSAGGGGSGGGSVTVLVHTDSSGSDSAPVANGGNGGSAEGSLGGSGGNGSARKLTGL